jgi:glycosyltransferase involved in cell wall biosynthesis
VIIATLNEEQGIGPTLTEINHFLDKPHCLVVDGRSIDQTVNIAELNGAQVILQKGIGKGDAIATGLKHVKELNVNYIAFIDADHTYPAKYLSKMINILEKNPEIGMVCGNRLNTYMESKAMGDQFYLGNKILSFSHKILNGVQLQDPLTGLRILRRELLNNWTPKSKGFDIEVELNHLVESKGFRTVEIPINYRRRIGEKKLKPIHGFTIFKRIILETFSSP